MKQALKILLLWVPLAVIALVAALLFSDRFLAASATHAVAWFSDYTLELDELGFSPGTGVLKARKLHLRAAGQSGPGLVYGEDLEVQGLFAGLWRGDFESATLSARSLVVYAHETGDDTVPEPRQWLAQLRWLPASASIDTVHLISQDENVWVFPLYDVAARRGDEWRLRLSARAEFRGEALGLELRLAEPKMVEELEVLEIGGAVSAPNSDSLVLIDGSFTAGDKDLDYAFDISGDFHDVAVFLRGVSDQFYDFGGILSLSGSIAGNLGGYRIAVNYLELDNSPEYRFRGEGSIDVFSDNPTLAVSAYGEMADIASVLIQDSVDLSRIGAVEARLDLSGPISAPLVDRFSFTSRGDEGLLLSLKGEPQGLPLGSGEWLAEKPLTLSASGPDLAVLKSWTGELPVRSGAWSATGTAFLLSDRLRVEQVTADIDSGAGGKLHVQGHIDEILTAEETAEPLVSGIGLNITLETPDLAAELARQDREQPLPLPADLAVKVSASATGDSRKILVDGLRLESLSSVAGIQINSGSATLFPESEQWLEQFQLDLSSSTEDPSGLAAVFDLPLPTLGKVSLQAIASGNLQQVDLSDIVLKLEGTQRLEVTGSVADVLDTRLATLTANVDRLDTAPWVSTFLPQYHDARFDGVAAGQVDVQVAGEQVSLSTPGVSLVRDDEYALQLSGSVNNVVSSPTGEFDVDFRFLSAGYLKDLIGVPLSPSDTRAHVRLEADSLAVNSTTQIGETSLNLLLDLAYSEEGLQRASLSLHTPSLVLPSLLDTSEFAFSLEDPEGENTEETATEEPGLWRDHLPDYPVDVRLTADEIVGAQTNATRFNLEFTGDQGRFLLRALDIGYPSGESNLRGVVDLNARPGAISVAGRGISLPLGSVMQDLGVDTDVTGELSFRGGLTAQGEDSAEAISHLDGSLSLAIRDATVKGAAFDLLMTDFFGWFVTGGVLQDKTVFDCSMASFLVKSGVAESDALYIETPNMVATGSARLDLPDRFMDVKLDPLSRQRSLQIPSQVRLRGPMDDPRVITSPITAAMDVSVGVATLVPRLVTKLFGIDLSSRKEAAPCEPD